MQLRQLILMGTFLMGLSQLSTAATDPDSMFNLEELGNQLLNLTSKPSSATPTPAPQKATVPALPYLHFHVDERGNLVSKNLTGLVRILRANRVIYTPIFHNPPKSNYIYAELHFGWTCVVLLILLTCIGYVITKLAFKTYCQEYSAPDTGIYKEHSRLPTPTASTDNTDLSSSSNSERPSPNDQFNRNVPSTNGTSSRGVPGSVTVTADNKAYQPDADQIAVITAI